MLYVPVCESPVASAKCTSCYDLRSKKFQKHYSRQFRTWLSELNCLVLTFQTEGLNCLVLIFQTEDSSGNNVENPVQLGIRHQHKTDASLIFHPGIKDGCQPKTPESMILHQLTKPMESLSLCTLSPAPDFRIMEVRRLHTCLIPMWGHHRATLTARLHSPLLEEELMFTVLKCPVPKVNAGFSRDQTPSLSSFPRLLKWKTQESTKGTPVKRQVEDFVFLFGLICYLYLWNNFSVQFSPQSCPTL